MLPFRSMSFGTNASLAEALDDRVARIGRQELVAVVDMRFGEVGDRRCFSQASQHVERGQGPRRVLDARRLASDLVAKRLEDLQLPLENPLIRPETFSSYSFSAGVV